MEMTDITFNQVKGKQLQPLVSRDELDSKTRDLHRKIGENIMKGD